MPALLPESPACELRPRENPGHGLSWVASRLGAGKPRDLTHILPPTRAVGQSYLTLGSTRVGTNRF